MGVCDNLPQALYEFGQVLVRKGPDIDCALGLRGNDIRAEPGLDGSFQFLAYDSEVFLVRDGPREVDGYTWWYLVAPYDETRVGWAAADFLTYIPAP
jgi:hypothetical protein